MTKYVFDSNAVSALLARDKAMVARFATAMDEEHEFLGCPIVYFEVKRGLKARDARKKIILFETLFEDFTWQDFNRADWEKAADLWAQRRAMGLPISDADLMIAVFTINRDAVLVTNNTKDFAELGVTLEDWSA